MTHADLRDAHTLWRARRFDEAASACQCALAANPTNPNALHLLGLIRKDAGDPGAGERLLRMSVALAPTRAEFRANLGNLLLRHARLWDAAELFRSALALDPAHRNARFGLARAHAAAGDHAAAQREFRKVLDRDPKDVQACSALADSLRSAGRFAEAEAAFRKALTLEPDRAVTRHNLGSLLSHIGRAEESLEELNRARDLDLQDHALIMNRARVLLQLSRLEEAEDAYAAAVRSDPCDAQAQRELAQLRFMRGDPSFARDALAATTAHRADPRPGLAAADVLRCSGNVQEAETLLRNLIALHGPLPQARATLATVLHEMGLHNEAEVEAVAAARARPLDNAIIENLVVIRLALGRVDQVMKVIEAQRVRQPFDQRWIAYEAAAARLRGHPRYGDLYDYSRLVRVYELDPPPGWSSSTEFNETLTAVLAQRHVFAMHPFAQSLRYGSQTARSLLHDSDLVIQAAIRAFADPIAHYRELIGTDAAHPLTRRNCGVVRLSGCWSVQLRRTGFHVNHIHPQGWISSAYYAGVPDEVADASLKSGWLKFGETPMQLPCDGPEYFVQPRVGRLVLFPSYMWHGTNAIHCDTPRTTIAFDVVPCVEP